ncbi:CxC2 domain-containing protein [Mycena chlorophos]|uniref:CxC2 domain-containing protein n=1 Tax=Mycena chlorophos TaxID=658473 RepID=A0A8H6TNK3_MYCCL|nr:CxC2 domain-containing protein [Mycena chlorophos]
MRVDVGVGHHVPGRETIHTQGVYLSEGAGGQRLNKRRRIGQVTVEKKSSVAPTQLTDQFASWTPLPHDDFDADARASLQLVGEKRKYQSTVDPMAIWRPRMVEFLDEVMRHEGLSDQVCATCRTSFVPNDPASARFFRCEQCGPHLQCSVCCLERHYMLPLHDLEEWNGSFWTTTSLKDIGLIYQLGHGGFPCPFPEDKTYQITILDFPIIHTVCVRYCGCNRCVDIDHWQQLMRNWWYPATLSTPSTCATFRTLRAFRLLNVVGNTNVTDFITAMERMTDTMSSSGLSTVPDRTRQFHRMSRQWTFMSRAKRAGRAHDPAGLEATPLGGCAVLCWACPHDGKNLPPDWRNADRKYQFLYMLILAVDANFRLKNRVRANEIHDPALGPGWGYWVEPVGYKEHVKKYISESDISTCIAFAALLQKDTRMTTGLRVSGVGGCVCARHECVRPNGLGDLQKGERYCNMDWIVFSALMGITLLLITISYDIACQWKVNLPQRLPRLPPALQKDLAETKIQFGLPVFHAPVHNDGCKDENHLSHQPGVAKTDGEGIERVWSVLNSISFSTKEMSLGHRADVIEDRIDNHNFLKNLALGATLQRRLVVALAERTRQIDAFEVVSDGVHPETIKTWKKALRCWEADHSQPNPLILATTNCPTEAEIRLQLQREEREQVENGSAAVAGSSMTSFLVAGIQIEDLQQRILDVASRPALLTAARETSVEEWRLSLLSKLARFRQLQTFYMPGAASAIGADEQARDSDAAGPPPERIQLYMPNQMPRQPRRASDSQSVEDGGPDLRGCRAGLAEAEERLRATLCDNSLVAIRSALNAKRWLIAYRNAHLVGQKQTTKAVKLIESVTERLLRHVFRYRRGYVALQQLGALNRYPHLHELKDDDIRLSMETDLEDIDAREKLNAVGARRGTRTARSTRHNARTTGESRRVMSWVWTASLGADDAELHDSIRVEWTRALVRKTRWCEEVMLLKEEMRRVLRFLRWRSNWWRAQARVRASTTSAAVAGGLEAYALRQAYQCESLLGHFQTTWGASAAESLQQLAVLDGMRDLEEDIDLA